MLEQLQNALVWLLGNKALFDFREMLQMALRAIIVFMASLVIVRLGHKRFFAKFSAFDVILAFILGSTLSRAINGSAPIFETIAVGFVLVGCHWVLSILSYRSHRIGNLFKGTAHPLIEDGKIRWDAMRQTRITRADLEEALRIHGKTTEAESVGLAVLERNGDISVIPAKKEAQQTCDDDRSESRGGGRVSHMDSYRERRSRKSTKSDDLPTDKS
ncbi:MAG: DUF421 domain-containing protein [Acidobacteriota bacterium]